MILLDIMDKFKVGDKVRQVGINGPEGIVSNVRVETVRNTVRVSGTEEPGVTVTVLWDNGTLSHFVPEGLEKIS